MSNMPDPSQYVVMTASDFAACVEQAAAKKEVKSPVAKAVAPTFDTNLYYTREEVRDMLRVNYSTLYRWNKQGYLCTSHLGRKVLYLKSVVAEFMELSFICFSRIFIYASVFSSSVIVVSLRMRRQFF